MAVINLTTLTIKEVHDLYRQGDFSCRELVEMYHHEIKKHNQNLNVYLEYFEDAFDCAKDIDVRIKKGFEMRPLEGIPFAIKDNILIKGKIASAASRILKNYHASYDASVIRRLRDAGAIFLGRTNMDEFAMGSSTENSAYGPTKNPYDADRVPGGSSGGSAAAVASGLALAALGSDTGGSIRQPAAFCGVVGLKPTYGSVSRSGLIAMASSFDQIGPFARSVEDAERIFEIIRGKDEKDATTVEYKEKKILRKPVIGIPREFGFDKEGIVEDDMLIAFMRAKEMLHAEGYEICDVSLPSTPYALAIYYIIMPAEVSSNLARFDGIRYGYSVSEDTLRKTYEKSRSRGFGRETRRRIMLGAYVLSAGYYDAYYGRAQKARSQLVQDFENVFREVDILLTLTTPTPPFLFGEKAIDPVKMYASDIFTVSANLSGVPAISIPFGTVEREGVSLPVGIQLMAPWFYESTLFEVGKVVEKYNF